MNQQINLYQPIFRKPRVLFSARTMLAFGLGFLLVLLAWSALMAGRVSLLESELESRMAAEERATGQLVDLQREAPDRPDIDALEETNQALSEQAARLESSLAVLQRRVPEHAPPLSLTMEALARRVPDGLWLTGVRLEDERLRLRGRALAARLVPEYLQALSDDPDVESREFRKLRLDSAEDGMPGVAFEIASQEEES